MRLSLRRQRMSEKELSFHLSLSRFQFHYLPLPLRISELARGHTYYKKTLSVAAIGLTATDRVMDVVWQFTALRDFVQHRYAGK